MPGLQPSYSHDEILTPADGRGWDNAAPSALFGGVSRRRRCFECYCLRSADVDLEADFTTARGTMMGLRRGTMADFDADPAA
jgi:hypothetical protein